nr:unnamed protein product [Fasciola hepatica]
MVLQQFLKSVAIFHISNIFTFVCSEKLPVAQRIRIKPPVQSPMTPGPVLNLTHPSPSPPRLADKRNPGRQETETTFDNPSSSLPLPAGQSTC